MTDHQKGWTVFLAALGMMAGLIAVDIRDLTSWSEATTPAFVSAALTHFGVVAAAFVGGRLIPTASKE